MLHSYSLPDCHSSCPKWDESNTPTRLPFDRSLKDYAYFGGFDTVDILRSGGCVQYTPRNNLLYPIVLVQSALSGFSTTLPQLVAWL